MFGVCMVSPTCTLVQHMWMENAECFIQVRSTLHRMQGWSSFAGTCSLLAEPWLSDDHMESHALSTGIEHAPWGPSAPVVHNIKQFIPHTTALSCEPHLVWTAGAGARWLP
jgi:hypothetical protein